MFRRTGPTVGHRPDDGLAGENRRSTASCTVWCAMSLPMAENWRPISLSRWPWRAKNAAGRIVSEPPGRTEGSEDGRRAPESWRPNELPTARVPGPSPDIETRNAEAAARPAPSGRPSDDRLANWQVTSRSGNRRVTVHRGLSRFSRRKGRHKRIDVLAAKMGLSPLRRERGQVHVFGRRFLRKRDFPPKNGPVPIEAVNA